jgi:DNA-binding response OmpR family regulator
LSSEQPGALIALIEDDARLSELISRYLRDNGYRVMQIADGDLAVESIRREVPRLVILDLGLPGQDGFSICEALRPTFTNPILILTARDNSADHIRGLELGADDYVIKPIEPGVLNARVNALMRRIAPAAKAERRILSFGALRIDCAARSVTLKGQEVSLSSSEYLLLEFLAGHAGQILSRNTLFQHLYKREYDGLDRILDIRVSHLRKKLGDEGTGAERIKTIWGKGYLFVLSDW